MSTGRVFLVEVYEGIYQTVPNAKSVTGWCAADGTEETILPLCSLSP